ncbi:hypothetical protein G9A89_015225 [Geosiphon pyriformis]|nr:hypothetical protein G9A89_015225 [Geosiphon pyriformis]
MVNAKIKEAMLSEILEIKNNPPEPVDIVLISNLEAFLDIKTGSKEFHGHYQNLAPTREEQKQHLKHNNNDNDLDSDSKSNLNYKQYIALLNLTKKQELKWFSDNNEGIMPEHIYNTDAGFDLKYLEKNFIKLELHSYICINLKIALEILTTIMVQLVSRSSLAKKRINIRRRIIDAGYIRNIIAMLQNDLEKAYIIDPNKKIAQAIFLLLVKIA